ncbi:MAG: ExeM/NucH family extracellular endonuclease, partial [Woeseia sp.]
LSHPMYVQDLHGLERYGELVLSSQPREMQFTSGNRPDVAGYEAHNQQRAARSLLLDDGSAEQNTKPTQYVNGELAPDFPLRVGDELQPLSGVLRFSRGSGGNGTQTWRLLPTATPEFANRNPRPAKPDVGGDLVIASFNVLNYFAEIDGGNAICGPLQKDGCRGADSAAELDRQRAKTSAAINALDADIVGLMELENSANASVDDLLSALNQRKPGWAAVRTGIVGEDAIQVALIYRADTVDAVGDFAVLDSSVDPDFDDNRNRPVVAQSFRAKKGGAAFAVAVAHLKSKGSPCDADNDPNRGDGQANCNQSRTLAARALVSWLASDPTRNGNQFALAIGDFNAYMNEDPIRAMEAGGLTNLLREYVGEGAWSLVYRGESGALDHAFATPSLAGFVSGAAEWHINADEAPLYDYNLEFARDPDLFEPDTPWRAADHDPLLIGLRLPAE